MIEPDAAELRVLGCLIEKQRTTPDAYPLSLNALRLATNQSTGREPVVDYDEDTVREAIARLVRRGWARLASGPGSRATKYRQLLDEALSLDAPALAVLAVLMLRGAQTPGELRQRTDRLCEFASLEQLEALLESLARRRLIERLDRRPGQKEARWRLGESFGVTGEPAPAIAATPSVDERTPTIPPSPPLGAVDGDLAAGVAEVEADLERLRAVVAQLRALIA